jgi:phospholipid/cholesterol/gamma-HCH transport system substrate-binding protein
MMRRRGSRRREERSALATVLAATAVFVLIAIFVVVTLRAPREVPIPGFSTLTASLPDVGNLRIHSEVRARGARIGEVTSIRPAGGRATVTLKLDPGVGDLPADTTASVRGKGLLGARYIDLHPGRSRAALSDGDTVRAAPNPITVSVSDALDTLDAPTRRGLETSVDQLGIGLLGNGQALNAAIHQARVAFADMRGVLGALDARPGAVGRLLPALDAALEPLADARDDIASGFAPAARALEPLVVRRDALRSALQEAPPALDAATAGLGAGRRLLASARSVAASASTTLPDVPRGLEAVTALLRGAPAPLRRGRVLLENLRAAVPAVLRITDNLAPVLAPLRRGLADTTPVVAKLGEHGCDIIDFGSNLRSVLNQGVAGGGPVGPLTDLRFTLLAAPDSVSGFAPAVPHPADEKFYPPCKFHVGGAR